MMAARNQSDALAKRLKDELEDMKAARRPFETVWNELSELILPRRPGGDRALVRPQLFDATAVFANEMLAASLAGQLINPKLVWFGLRMVDDALNKNRSVRLALDQYRERVMAVLNSTTSLFHPQAHELLLDIGALGTSAMFVRETADGGITFSTRHVLEIYIRENARGEVDTVFRVWQYTARQAAQFYGADRLPERIRRKLADKPDEKFTFLQAVFPREERRVGMPDALNKPWASVHVALDIPATITVGGFNEFPYLVPRWQKVAGEVYGRSPGMTVLPDIRMLQRMSEVQIKAAQLVIWPPMSVPDEGMMGPVSLLPGALNIFRATSKHKPEPLITGARPDLGLDVMNQKREAILRAFFFDLTELREGPDMTATEVLARRDERFRRMTPMLTRLQNEFLAPLIDRVIRILARQGKLPPMPEEAEGKEFEIEFVSPAALAQEAAEADNMTRFLQRVAPVLALDQAAAANINVDEYIREMARKFNVPQRIIADMQQVQALRQQLAQQQQIAEAVNVAQGGSEAVRNIVEAVSSGNQQAQGS